ncbi:uncharacterized protein NDAI_0G01120 [Naumovozyma dairenensis CBS 421]|uniref:PA14 domain-containing protein n=1 Tax=Naumovozyma dairenensis (strain ATCC 10597 / BCRC 20456 / CBS 421 / NBRC 0211 / NRRL Y-12639) TaxID=1071378 RepID=G0WDM7_NAUDC|nr:hypothetical protein NDAI_0G01120 [Naumovozyma dairenensis CBS 421]CCD25888.2 hypothetical protein NDAI_0G01120 [Naumovozyma dairenensis CBS 421]
MISKKYSLVISSFLLWISVPLFKFSNAQSTIAFCNPFLNPGTSTGFNVGLYYYSDLSYGSSYDYTKFVSSSSLYMSGGSSNTITGVTSLTIKVSPSIFTAYMATVYGKLILANAFVAEATGYFVPPTTGTYTFSLSSSDDVVGFFLDTDKAFNCCGDGTSVPVAPTTLQLFQQTPTTTGSVKLTLTQGVPYPIKYVYLNRQGDGAFNPSFTDPAGTSHTDWTGYIITDTKLASLCPTYPKSTRSSLVPWTGISSLTLSSFTDVVVGTNTATTLEYVYVIRTPSPFSLPTPYTTGATFGTSLVTESISFYRTTDSLGHTFTGSTMTILPDPNYVAPFCNPPKNAVGSDGFNVNFYSYTDANYGSSYDFTYFFTSTEYTKGGSAGTASGVTSPNFAVTGNALFPSGSVYGTTVRRTNFVAELYGYFVPPTSGTYSFVATGADDFVAYFFSDSTSFTCCAGAQPSAFQASNLLFTETYTGAQTNSAIVNLIAGVPYPIGIRYLNRQGDATLNIAFIDPAGVTHTDWSGYIAQASTLNALCPKIPVVTKTRYTTWSGASTITSATSDIIVGSDWLSTGEIIYVIKTPAPFSLPPPYTTTVTSGTLTYSGIVSYYPVSSTNGLTATGRTTSTIPPPFTLPPPYTTTFRSGTQTYSGVVSYYPVSSTNGWTATGRTTSTIPPIFSLPPPYTTTVTNPTTTYSAVVSYYPATSANGWTVTRTTTSTIPPPFSLPPPYTTTVSNPTTTYSAVVSYYPMSSSNGLTATGRTTSTIPPPFSLPPPYTTTVSNPTTTYSAVVSYYPMSSSNGLTATGRTTSTIPPPFSLPPPYTTTVLKSSSTVTELISFYATEDAVGMTITGTTTSTIFASTTTASSSIRASSEVKASSESHTNTASNSKCVSTIPTTIYGSTQYSTRYSYVTVDTITKPKTVSTIATTYLITDNGSVTYTNPITKTNV